MKRTLLKYLIGAVLLLCGPLYATTIDPILWQQMAVNCDFAGVVECTVAGGIVAEYKVVDAWKGSAYTEPICISVAVNYWEPQFPMTLVGEQYVVFAYSNKAPANITSMTTGGPVPLWWRQIKHDYTLPLFQGRYLIDANNEVFAIDFGYRDKSKNRIAVSEIKNNVHKLVTQTKQQQEVALLKIQFNKYFVERNTNILKNAIDKLSSYENATDAAEHQETINDLRSEVKRYKQEYAQVEPVYNKIRNCTNSAEVIDLIYDLMLSKTTFNGFQSVFEKAILTTETLDHLKKRIDETDETLLKDSISRFTPDRIQARIMPTEPTPQPEPIVETYTPEEVKEHLAILDDYKNKESYEWSKSFYILVEQNPIQAAKWLKGWKNSPERWQDEGVEYELASWLAFNCDQDREKCLDILLNAKELYVRVAGAVYLCYEDEDKAEKYLKRFSGFEGEPGRWAALNLARRGDKEALEDMIVSFYGVKLHDSGMLDVPCRNLAKRMMVLLSNSAAISGVPLPPNPLDDIENFDDKLNPLSDWWDKYKSEITLYDAWLGILKEQKVD